MTPPPDDSEGHRPGWVAPAVVMAIALGLYVATLMPGMAFDDWGEMQTVPHVLGVAHPTGYPTYLLTAWLFELLPIGSVAWRANLLSAVCVAVALGSLTAIGQRIGVRPWLAAVAALATGAVATVWASALVAEVNPLHLALMALLIHRSLVWADDKRLRDLALGGLLVGLGLGNHLLTGVRRPVLRALRAVGRTARPAREAAVAARAGARGRRGRGGLPVHPARGAREPAAALQPPDHPRRHPVPRHGRAVPRPVQRPVHDEQHRAVPVVVRRAGGAGGLEGDARRSRSSASIGLGLLVLRRPAFGLACWAALIAGIDVWANYLHLEHYLLVPWLLLGIGVAVALDTVATLLTGALARLSAGDGAARVVVLGTAAVGAGLAIALVVVNLPTVDRHDDNSGQAYADEMMTKLPPNAAIFSYWASTTPLWHARFVEGMRPDVLIVDDTNIVYEGWQSRERRIATLICDRPVYVMRPFDKELDPTRAQYDLTEAFQVRVGLGTPDAVETVPVYRVDARPGQCP